MEFHSGSTGYDDNANNPGYWYLHDLAMDPIVLGRNLSVFPPLNNEQYGQILYHKIAEAPWSPVHTAFRNNKTPLDQYTNRLLPSEKDNVASWQTARTAVYRQGANSPWDSRPSSETQSVRNLSWSGESVRSHSVMSTQSGVTDYASDSGSVIPSTSAAANESLTCRRCPWWVASTPSEKRKHDARHNAREKKAHQCEHCNKSFGTRNDLERHQKCVHQNAPWCGSPKSFKCFGSGCAKGVKLLSRWDNLKAHIQRKHDNEDGEKLLRLSWEWYKKGGAESGNGESTTEGICISDDDRTTDLDILDGSEIQRKRLRTERPSTERLTVIHSLADDKLIEQSLRCPYGDPLHGGPIDSAATLKKLPCIRSVFNSDIPSELDSPGKQTGALPGLRSLDRGVALFKAMALQKLSKEEPACQQQIERVTLDARQADNEPKDNVPSIGNLPAREKAFLLSLVSEMKSELTQQVSQDNRTSHSDSQQPASKIEEVGRADFTCSDCHKVFTRQCAFRKHVIRHEKRYGCTFPDCFRAFGSKADWKRHENTRHFHCRSFRCCLPMNEHPECAQLFFREDNYREHLRNCHAVVDIKEINSQVSRNQIGKNGQNQFWCGFCRQIKPLKSKGLDAWKERFDHIDSEHFRKGQRIGDWLPPSGHLVKSELEKRQQGNQELGKTRFESVPDEEFMSDSQEDEPGSPPDDENPTEESGGSDERETLEKRPAPSNNSIDIECGPVSPSPPDQIPEKTGLVSFVSMETLKKGVDPRDEWQEVIFCCSCKSGPYLRSINTHCPGCGAIFCFNCLEELHAL